MTNADIVAPAVQVSYTPGEVTEGGAFVFDDTWWHLRLNTRSYSARGTYTVSMVSGDTAQYVIAPTCTAQFVVE